MIGKTLGNYEIREPLGAGGMGEVYLAHDTNLKRDVAIKVLPEALTVDEQRLARLEREAQLLAAVNHPNIAAIYNLERDDEVRWLVLELVDGETLEQRLRKGPLDVDEALRISGQIASALEAAHEKGIVHRDLKAANVMVDAKGRVKVLDFGIAKDVSEPSEGGVASDAVDTSLATHLEDVATHLTATGAIVGTAPYMSPEQIRGKDIDKRTDNWAFGCLLYELLTGRRPFDRETMVDTLSAILEHDPDWDLLPEDAPPSVDALLSRCLQKDVDSRLRDIGDARIEIEQIATTGVGAGLGPAPVRGGRVSSAWSWWVGLTVAAAVVAAALLWWGAGNFGPSAAESPPVAPVDLIALSRKAIAVLPFEHAAPPETEYFSEGTVQAVMAKLQGVDGLEVREWRSSKVQDPDADPLEIGGALGVSRYIEGGVYGAGDEHRIVVRLIDSLSGNRLWQGEFFQNLKDADSINELQQDIAFSVVEALELELSADESARIRNRMTNSVAAFDAYLRGLEAFPRRTVEDLTEAREHFERAISEDDDFAEAHAYHAATILGLRNYGSLPNDVAFALAGESAQRALEIDNTLGLAHLAIGVIKVRSRQPDWRIHYETALELSPNDSLVLLQFGTRLLESEGATQRAWNLTARAGDQNPLDPPPHENLGWWYFQAGDMDSAIEQMEHAVDLDDRYPLGHMGLGVAMHYGGRAEEAIPHLREGLRLGPADGERHHANLGSVYASIGRYDDAVSSLKARFAMDPNVAGYSRDLADVYLQRGNLSEAEAGYAQSVVLQRAVRNRLGEKVVWLDWGDFEGAAEYGALLGASNPTDSYGQLIRLNIDVFAGEYTEAGLDLARNLASDSSPLRIGPETYGAYNRNWTFYENQWPRDPVGYYGVLAGDPAVSLMYFENNFPDLLEDAPPVHVFTLKAAIDLVVVYRALAAMDGVEPRLRDEYNEKAEVLLERSAAYIAGLPDLQRRHQFRLAPMQIYALQGETEAAIEAMLQAEQDGLLSGWWRLDKKPHLESLHGDQRFIDLIERLRIKALEQRPQSP